MFYDLTSELDKERFKKRVNALYQRGSLVELSEKKPQTNKQNSYVHLLIGVVAMELGERLEYVKTTYFKRLVNKDLFVAKRLDSYLNEEVEELKSSRELTKEEMCLAIDRFKRWGEEIGLYMPDANEEEKLGEVWKKMEQMNNYL